MSRARVTALTFLLVGGFALLARPVQAQQDLPSKDRRAISAVTNYRDTPRGGIPQADLKGAREHFANFAKYYADVIAHPAVWKASLDPKSDPLIPSLDGPNSVLRDLDRFLLVPATGSTRGNLEPSDYIRELGAAFDAALKALIETNPERIVRVNAARVLAQVAAMGAPAHFPTVAALLANANTPTEVKYYLFHAAAALLAAPDVTDPRVRKHAVDEQTVGALIKAIDDNITNPALLLSGVPVDKPEAIDPDQLAVVGLVRRQAIRALAQVKFVKFPGPDGKTLYPAYTLARVALSDPALSPPPAPADAAEAVIGLCNMAPVVEKNGRNIAVREYDPDVAVEAITAGLITFASPRAANAFDRSLPWRTYALRIAEAMRNWRPLFDVNYDPTQPTKFSPQQIPTSVEEMYKAVIPRILAPMDKVDFMGKPDIGARVEIEGLRKRLADIRANPKRGTLLFKDVPTTTIDFAPPKK